jgi:PKD repeat protein
MFVVSLTVIDPSGISDTETTTATIAGSQVPLVVSAGGPYSGAVRTIITFTGTASGGQIFPAPQYQFVWSFGDGSSGFGQTAAHAYVSPGTYRVVLTVSAPSGQTASATTTATVQQTLTISAGTSTSGIAGSPVNFGATVIGATSPQVTWTFGDGTTGNGAFTTHTYANPGTYTATASVVDLSTGQRATDSIFVTIGGALSVDANGPYIGLVGEPVSMVSTVTGGTNPSYVWNFGDGGSGSGANPTHTYSSPGTYTITLTVTASGQSASDTATAMITQAGPIVSYGPGWNLVGGPAGTIFSQASGPLFTFPANSTTYQVLPNTTPVQAGAGYWAFFNQRSTVTLAGNGTTTATINVPAGQFVMIGNPSGTQAVSINGADLAVSWDPQANAWKDVSSLAPGAGAWVYVSGGGVVSLAP